jgi:low temperature requirement protein LtrA
LLLQVGRTAFLIVALRGQALGEHFVNDLVWELLAGVVGYWGTWTLTLIVLALIGVAVGDEMAIAHPGDDATLGFTLLTFGGPALFLLAQVIFTREAVGRVPRSRPLALAGLAILAAATAPLTMIVGIAASTAVLVAVAIADTVRGGVRPPGAPA